MTRETKTKMQTIYDEICKTVGKNVVTLEEVEASKPFYTDGINRIDFYAYQYGDLTIVCEVLLALRKVRVKKISW